MIKLSDLLNEIKFDSNGQMKIKKQYNSVSDFEKNAKNGDYVWVGKNPKDFKNIGQSYLSKVVGKDEEGNAILTPWKRNKKYTIPQKDQLVFVVETTINEETWKADKNVITLDGEKVGDYSFDRDADGFFIDDISGKGQKGFDTKGEMLAYIKAHKADYLKARKDYTSKGYKK